MLDCLSGRAKILGNAIYAYKMSNKNKNIENSTKLKSQKVILPDRTRSSFRLDRKVFSLDIKASNTAGGMRTAGALRAEERTRNASPAMVRLADSDSMSVTLSSQA